MGMRDAAYMKLVTTAIPGSGSDGVELRKLLIVSTDAKETGGVATNEYITADELRRVVDWVVLKELPADGTTDRPAFNVASLAGMTRFYQVASATAFGPSSMGNMGCGVAGPLLAGPFFRSASSSAIAAGILVWIAD